MGWEGYEKRQHPRGLVEEAIDLVDAEEQENLLSYGEKIKFIDMPSQYVTVNEYGDRDVDVHRLPGPLIRLIAEVVNSDDFMRLLKHRAEENLKLAREKMASTLRARSIDPDRKPYEKSSLDDVLSS